MTTQDEGELDVMSEDVVRVDLEHDDAPIESMREIFEQIPNGAKSVMLRGGRGVGKTWLAMRTLLEFPGSLYIATEESHKVLESRLRYLHGRFGGTPFTIVEACGLGEIKARLASISMGRSLICLDGLSVFRTKAAAALLKHHREFGTARLLCTAYMEPRSVAHWGHWVDAAFRLEEHALVEEKNRYRLKYRRYAFDVARVAGVDPEVEKLDTLVNAGSDAQDALDIKAYLAKFFDSESWISSEPLEELLSDLTVATSLSEATKIATSAVDWIRYGTKGQVRVYLQPTLDILLAALAANGVKL